MAMTQVIFEESINDFNRKVMLPEIMKHTTVSEINKIGISTSHWSTYNLYEIFIRDDSLQDMHFVEIRDFLPTDLIRKHDTNAMVIASNDNSLDLLMLTETSTRAALYEHMRNTFIVKTMNERLDVEVRITATVTTTVTLDVGETLDDVAKRDVDIYLHGGGSDGHLNKEDLGGDSTITIIG